MLKKIAVITSVAVAILAFQNCGGGESGGTGQSVANQLSSPAPTPAPSPAPIEVTTVPEPTPHICMPSSSQACPIANGKGSQMCNAVGGAWMDCQATTCDDGFTAKNGACAVTDDCSGRWEFQYTWTDFFKVHADIKCVGANCTLVSDKNDIFKEIFNDNFGLVGTCQNGQLKIHPKWLAYDNLVGTYVAQKTITAAYWGLPVKGVYLGRPKQ